MQQVIDPRQNVRPMHNGLPVDTMTATYVYTREPATGRLFVERLFQRPKVLNFNTCFPKKPVLLCNKCHLRIKAGQSYAMLKFKDKDGHYRYTDPRVYEHENCEDAQTKW